MRNELLGMLLSRNPFSATGLLLLNRGIMLDATKIESIQRYYRLDPAQQGVFVYYYIPDKETAL